MKHKRLCTILLLVVLLIVQTGIANIIMNPTYAAEEKVEIAEYNHYFYQQLRPEAKQIYDGMVSMYQKGIFKTGKGEYNLTENGQVTEAQIEATLSGSNELLLAYGAARDAFVMDFPDVFYVDFSYLSIKINRDKTGKYNAYLGAERGDTYYLPGYTSETQVEEAIQKYEETINSLVTEAKNLPAKEGKNPTVQQVEFVHDYITKHMIYRFEDEVTQGNARTAYDCIVYGEGVCEAYTRGFKAVLDRLGIPCVCVYGVYKVSDTVEEEHIWNYVKIDGKWYGVDVTHDDPTGSKITSKESGKETRDYLLVGQLELAPRHMPSAILSIANYAFTYPTLEVEALNGKVTHQNKDLMVEVVEAEYSEGSDEVIESGTMKVSYQKKNYTQNAAEGKYILARFAQYYPGNDTWLYSDWAYITPELYDTNLNLEPTTPDPKMGYYVQLPMPHIKKAQFAVTTIAPDTSTEGILAGGLYYHGDPALLDIQTEEVENIWGGDYVAPPYPKKVTPYGSGKLYIGQSYDISVTYDDVLKPIEGEKIGIELETSSATGQNGSNTGMENSKIENVKFDGISTITFRFTPSAMYADDSCYYTLHIKGLQGEKSAKRPIDLSYLAGYPCASCCLKSQGIDWNVFGQPYLIEDENMSTEGWVAKDTETGEILKDVKISEKITHRLALVTTEPSKAQTKQMNDLLSQTFEENILKSETYNIKLTLCKKQIIQTGQGVRVRVGFPQGYNYNSKDEGITFKAYHYLVDSKTNQITGVEEIECVVTQYGLILTVDSFSPFAIAAVKTSDVSEKAKTVLVSHSENGRVEDEKGNVLEGTSAIITMQKGETKTLNIIAEEGAEIDTITIAGKKVEVPAENKTKMAISLKYDELEGNTNVHVQFVTIVEPSPDTTEKPEETTPPEETAPEKEPTPTPEENTTLGESENIVTPQEEPELPNTGDMAIEWFVGLMIVSALGIALILYSKKKGKKGKH